MVTGQGASREPCQTLATVPLWIITSLCVVMWRVRYEKVKSIMLHRERIHAPLNCSVEGLLWELTPETSLCACGGFRVEHRGETLLFLNDMTSADGAQEYCVLVVQEDLGDGEYRVQEIESLSISWMAPEKCRAVLKRQFDATQRTVWGEYHIKLDSLDGHRCPSCA